MKIIASIYQLVVYFGKFLQPFVLLAFRLFWGWQFFVAGYGKLQDMSQVIEFFTSLGIPNAAPMAYAVAWIETIGGICLFLGFLSRLAAIPLSAVMLGALATAHVGASKAILSNPSQFIDQMPVTFLMASLVVLAFGPGLFSLDALFNRAIYSEKS